MRRSANIYKVRLLARYKRLREAFRRKILQHKATSEHFQSLIEYLSIGIFTVDLTGRIQFFNREAERISGYSREEIRDSHFRTLLSLDDLSDGFKAFYQAIHGLYPKSLLFRIRKKDGSTMIAELEVAPYYREGKQQGIIAFMKDLSERKKLEEANRKRVESFIRLSRELDEWQCQVLSLKREVNNLLVTFGQPQKYSLPEEK